MRRDKRDFAGKNQVMVSRTTTKVGGNKELYRESVGEEEKLFSPGAPQMLAE